MILADYFRSEHDTAWVEKIAKCAEDEWGMTDFNLVIDDSWQLSRSMKTRMRATR